MDKQGAIKKGVRVRHRHSDEAGSINSVHLNDMGEVGISVVWEDRRSGVYDPKDIVLEDWLEPSN